MLQINLKAWENVTVRLVLMYVSFHAIDPTAAHIRQAGRRAGRGFIYVQGPMYTPINNS